MSHPAQGNLIVAIDAQILEIQEYVSKYTAKSTRKLLTAAHIWTRRLAKEAIPPETIKKPAPRNFAKWNDGFGESGITLEESKRGIKAFIKNDKKEGGQ